MGATWHIIFAIGYVILGLITAFVVPAIWPEVGILNGILSGVVIALTFGLGHEILRRKAFEGQTHRHMLALKKAYDQHKAELAEMRSELFQQAAGGIPTRPAPPPPIAPQPAVPASPQRDTVIAEEDIAPPSAAATPQSGQQEADTVNPRDEAAMEAEVKVLRSLVEQLYKEDIPTSARTSRSGGDTGSNEKSRMGLRVVGKNNGKSEILDTVKDALRNERVDLYLQPIVSLPQRKRRFFECFSRIRTADGTVLQENQFMPVARKEGLEATVDNMLLFRSVQLLQKVRAHDYSMAFFCNLSPNSLSDENFLQEFTRYMESHQDLAPSLVLELTQADMEGRLEALTPHLERLGSLGYRFALDGVTDFTLNVNALAQRHFHFVKVNAQALVDRLKATPGGGEVRSLKQQLDDRGIDMIVEHIETEQMLIELLDFNIDYGQGFLFGEPRLSKDPSAGGMRAG